MKNISVPVFVMLLFSVSYSARFRADTVYATKGGYIYGALTPKATSVDTVLGITAGDSVARKVPKSGFVPDSSGKAGTAYGFVHGVPTGILLKAKSASQCTSSHVSENGDTTKVTYQSPVSDTFTNTGTTMASLMLSACTAPNGDVYFGGSNASSGMYVQIGGSGSVSLVTATAYSSISGMAASSGGSVYSCAYSGYIRKRANGTGSFDTISGTIKNWYDITCDRYSGDIFYGVTGDTVYNSYDSCNTWAFFQKITGCQNIKSDNWGNLYLTANGNVYKKPYGSSSFYLMSALSNAGEIGIDTSGTVYIDCNNYSYRSIGGTGPFVLFQHFSFNIGFVVGKANGDMYTGYAVLWEKTSENLKTAFYVNGGNTLLGGKLSVKNLPVTLTSVWAITKNSDPDNEIKKTLISSLDVDSARASGAADTSFKSGSVDGYSVSDSTVVSTSYVTVPDNSTLKKISMSNLAHNIGIVDSSLTIRGFDSLRIRDAVIDSAFIYKGTKTFYFPLVEMP